MISYFIGNELLGHRIGDITAVGVNKKFGKNFRMLAILLLQYSDDLKLMFHETV